LEANMPFCLGSYLLGVGTVVGALAFGFGGGLLLTHTAMKESPTAQTRVERLARVHSNTAAARQAPVTQIAPAAHEAAVASDQVTIPDQDHSASLAAIKPDVGPEQLPAIAPDPHAGTSQLTSRKPEETPRLVQAATEPRQPIKQAAREPQPSKQAELTEKRATTLESMEADRSAELARRYVEPRRYVERSPPHGTAKPKHRGFGIEGPAQEIAMSRPPGQQRLDLFGGFFGRSAVSNE
jgi:hypothetical protein